MVNRPPFLAACVTQTDSALVPQVSAKGGHRGKRLGHVVTAAVLHRLKALGYSRCAITTTAPPPPAAPTSP